MPDKYQEEIEELLRGMGEKTPPASGREMETPPDDAPIVPHQTPRVPNSRSGGGFRLSLSPGKLMLMGLGLLLIGSFLPVWKLFLILGGLALIGVGYSMHFFKPRSVSIEKRWRGQAMEEEPTSWNKFRRWFKM